MIKEDKDKVINKIESMSKEEVKSLIIKACEATGLTLEDIISTDWEEVFTKRKHNKKPDFTNHIENVIDYPN